MSLFDRWTKKRIRSKDKPLLEKKEIETGQKAPSFAEERNKEISKEISAKGQEAFRVLLRPVVTEKTASRENQGVYSFEVFPGANKTEIKKAVEGVFGVKVKAVNIVLRKGKRVRFGRREGQRRGIKKALVFLEKGQTLSLYKNV
ncbi:MAG: 50S ribosomal protein L23 [Candidatus Magasanikbacteria bacterium]|nr:50S ribosomal protein L23 [Candidatus Magasanikbacteria bacterium]